ncbi:hypothetical protein EB001_09635 [bacterium]|nr:hypothetical protein [bacterium]
MGAGPCWTKTHYVSSVPVVVGTSVSVPLIQPFPTQPVPYVVYQPVVVQQKRLVTVELLNQDNRILKLRSRHRWVLALFL